MILKKKYDFVQSYTPLDFSENPSLTVGDFLEAADINVYFELGLDIWSWNCSVYDSEVKFYTLNPPMNISFNSTFDFSKLRCRVDINQTAMPELKLPLESNFTMNFECDFCTNGYQVGMKEVFVNSGGTYENRFLTQVNSNFR